LRTACGPSVFAFAAFAFGSLVSLRRVFNIHARARTEEELAFAHDHFAGREAFGDHRFALLSLADGD